LEQQLAPYKTLADSGIDAGRVQGLAQFAQQFEANPLETWLGMGAQLQEAGVVHQNLDLTELQAVSQGIDTDQGVGGGDSEGEGEMPAWAQQMMQQIQQMQNESQQEKAQRAQRLQDQLLQRQINTVKAQLQESGVQLPQDPQEAEALIVGHIIAHKGNVENATKAMTGFRESNLQAAVTQRQGQQQKEPTLPKGTPPAPPRNQEGPPPRDAFAAQRSGAQQFLEQAAASAAEEG